jgi:hypothetical protein
MAKSKKTRPKRSSNLTGDILKELQATIAFACFDSPSLIRRGASMAEAQIESMMSQIYYGDDTKGAPDPDLILFEDQLILGLSKFKGLYTRSVLEGPNAESGVVQLSIPEILHRHKNLQIYVGEGSIEKKLLSQKSLHVTDTKISGRTLHGMAKTVLKNCKKMMAIVKRKDSPYKDGRFPSGSNWEDYILWCLIEMGKECDREEAEKIDSAPKEAVAEKVLTVNDKGTGGEEQGEGKPAPVVAGIGTSNSFSAEEEDRHPNKKFFKCGSGFIAWALWGHIPIIDSSGMQTDFFSDAKKKASFGRKTESRAAFRKKMVEANTAEADNRRGKKRRAEEEEASTLTPMPAAVDSSRILAKTLEYMAFESIENKRQKLADLGMRNIRDKLVSRRRKEDGILQQLDRLSRGKKKPDQALLDKQTAIENEIASLEKKLDELQCEEYRRHSDVINQRSLELTASSSSEDQSIARTDSNNESSGADSVENCPIDVDISNSEKMDSDDDDDVDIVAPVNTITTNKVGCIECNLSSNHSCRKCKKCVCSLCCSEKRELENAWWCEICFKKQTVASQQLIRDGRYYSSDEED